MLLSVQKSECSFFSTNSHESKWQTTLTPDGQPVHNNATPKFLGVTYDRQLTFSCHAALVDNSLKQQTRALQKLASTSWIYDHQTLCATYIAAGRSKVEYGASTHLPWTLNTTLENLERSQCYMGQGITEQLHTILVEAILAERNLPSIKTQAIQQSMAPWRNH